MIGFTSALLLVLLAYAVASPLPGVYQDDQEEDYKLPRDIIPDVYTLKITPEYNKGKIIGIESFSGVVNIKASVKSQVNKIVLHCAQNIEIDDICVEYSLGSNNQGGVCTGQGQVVVQESPEYHNVTEMFTINLKDNIAPPFVTISIAYHSLFNPGGLSGFYYSDYIDANGENSAMLATYFEPTHARKAFPCFDEPSIRARFRLSIQVDDGISAIANTAGDRTDNTVIFEEIPSMPTYLLAFIIYYEGSFSATDPDTVFTHKTWGRTDAIAADYGDLSQRDGPRMIEFMNNYLNIKYETFMTKIDQVALPDFDIGGMENWGLITYRESTLLFDKATGTTAAHKRVSDIIAHELVHQWFGNLVSLQWWDSVWLKEGSANYFELLIMDNAYPKWRMPERFLLDEQMSVFPLDATQDSVPLTKYDVRSPQDISRHFGSISYSKGAAILRQISNVIGDKSFQEACRKYLQQSSYSSASADIFIQHIVNENEPNKTGLTSDVLKEALNTWTLLPGFPVINVTRTSTNQFRISQERFLQTPETLSEVTDMPLYYVPLTWTTSKEPAPVSAGYPQAWLSNRTSFRALEIGNIDDNDWVLFNSWQSGYYRVNYDGATWDKITAALRADPAAAAPVDRAAIVDNLLNLARAGHVTYQRALAGIRFLREDEDFVPWAAARTALAHLDRMLANDKSYKAYIENLVQTVYNKQEWETKESDDYEEDNVALTHRTNVLTMACAAGHSGCLSQSENLIKNISGVHKELQSVVYCYALKRASNRILWDDLWDEWVKASNNAARRGLLTTALGCTNNKEILTEYLVKSLNPAIVRPQDAYTVFTAVYSNPSGVDVALDFLDKRGYDNLESAYGSVRNVMFTIVSGLANRLTTDAQREKLEAALGDKAEAHATALQTVESNILWATNFGSDIKAALGAAPATAVATSVLLLCTAVLALLR